MDLSKGKGPFCNDGEANDVFFFFLAHKRQRIKLYGVRMFSFVCFVGGRQKGSTLKPSW